MALIVHRLRVNPTNLFRSAMRQELQRGAGMGRDTAVHTALCPSAFSKPGGFAAMRWDVVCAVLGFEVLACLHLSLGYL